MDGDGADRFGAFVNSLAEVVGHADRVPVFELALDMRRSARSREWNEPTRRSRLTYSRESPLFSAAKRA